MGDWYPFLMRQPFGLQNILKYALPNILNLLLLLPFSFANLRFWNLKLFLRSLILQLRLTKFGKRKSSEYYVFCATYNNKKLS